MHNIESIILLNFTLDNMHMMYTHTHQHMDTDMHDIVTLDCQHIPYSQHNIIITPINSI